MKVVVTTINWIRISLVEDTDSMIPKGVQSAPTTIGIRRSDEPDQSLVTLGDSAIIEQVGSCSFSPWHDTNITLDGGGINACPWRLQMDIDCLSSVEVFIVSYQTMKLRNLTSGV